MEDGHYGKNNIHHEYIICKSINFRKHNYVSSSLRYFFKYKTDENHLTVLTKDLLPCIYRGSNFYRSLLKLTSYFSAFGSVDAVKKKENRKVVIVFIIFQNLHLNGEVKEASERKGVLVTQTLYSVYLQFVCFSVKFSWARRF